MFFTSILREIKDVYPIGVGLKFDWDDKTPGANYLLFELLGEKTYAERLQLWKEKIFGTQKTPNGMIFLDKWGSARHAMNISFLLILFGIQL